MSAANEDGDSMRRMLEESWNTSKMGRVPADPESAAKEAYSSILQAAGAKATEGEEFVEEDNTAGVFFVDLLLPAYDMSLKQDGVNLYDEVLAVEYCIALADCFKGKTEIVVRDDSIVRTVAKILKAREERELEKAREEEEQKRALEEEERRKAKEEEERRKTQEEGEGTEIIVSDGDFIFGDGSLEDDTEDTEDDAEEDSVFNVESESDEFRKKLLASWNDVSDSTPDDGTDIPSTESILSSIESETVSEAPTIAPKPYRLASLFGNARVIEGPDMASVVVGAVRANALPADDEDSIIILSASGNDEMVAVRALVTKYESQKKIILVNCQFQPVPRELMTAETVYSVLPLAGKKKANTDDGPSDDGNQQPSPKIVVLRRYPKDWEVFVDVGIGYELAETIPVNNQNRRGLPMEFIARSVTRHLDYVSRR
eukprot:jgi/Psemu1/180391/e_gw1.14.284.1